MLFNYEVSHCCGLFFFLFSVFLFIYMSFWRRASEEPPRLGGEARGRKITPGGEGVGYVSRLLT